MPRRYNSNKYLRPLPDGRDIGSDLSLKLQFSTTARDHGGSELAWYRCHTWRILEASEYDGATSFHPGNYGVYSQNRATQIHILSGITPKPAKQLSYNVTHVAYPDRHWTSIGEVKCS